MTESVWSTDGIILMMNTEVLRGTEHLSQWHSVHHKFHMNWAFTVPGWQLTTSATAWPVSVYRTLLNADASAASATWLNEQWR